MIADAWILSIALMAVLGLVIAGICSTFVSQEFFNESLFPFILLGVISLAIGTCSG